MSQQIASLLAATARRLELSYDPSKGALENTPWSWEPPEHAASKAARELRSFIEVRHVLRAAEGVSPALRVRVPLDPALPVRFRLRVRASKEAPVRLLGRLFDDTFAVTTKRRRSLAELLDGPAKELLFDAMELGFEPRLSESSVELWLLRGFTEAQLNRALELSEELAEELLDAAVYSERSVTAD